MHIKTTVCVSTNTTMSSSQPKLTPDDCIQRLRAARQKPTIRRNAAPHQNNIAVRNVKILCRMSGLVDDDIRAPLLPQTDDECLLLWDAQQCLSDPYMRSAIHDRYIWENKFNRSQSQIQDAFSTVVNANKDVKFFAHMNDEETLAATQEDENMHIMKMAAERSSKASTAMTRLVRSFNIDLDFHMQSCEETKAEYLHSIKDEYNGLLKMCYTMDCETQMLAYCSQMKQYVIQV